MLPHGWGYNQTGNGFFAQDKDQQAMRVETMRPSLGLGDLLINATDLWHGCTVMSGSVCVWVSICFHDIPWHFTWQSQQLFLLECRMSDARDSAYLVSGRPGPRVVQNKSYVMTGGEHPICRVLPFFGQQRSLCDLGRISGKRWGFHKEPVRDPNQLWHGVPTGTALENPAILGRYSMLCECYCNPHSDCHVFKQHTCT